MNTTAPMPPYQRHSDTSKGAADSVREDRAPILRDCVLACFDGIGCHGFTDEELINELQAPSSSVRPRRVELTHAVKVVDSGRYRFTRSGRKAVVWIAASHCMACENCTEFRGNLLLNNTRLPDTKRPRA